MDYVLRSGDINESDGKEQGGQGEFGIILIHHDKGVLIIRQ